MKSKKLLASLLAGAMLMTSSYSLAIAEGTDIVYTYQNENGETVNITQAELDAEHWNVNALGASIPTIYKAFPMSVNAFVNDFAEVSLDIVYMKDIEDFTDVSLSIYDVISGEYVYNQSLTEFSFYSPVLEADKQYVMTLTETIDGTSTEYHRLITTQKIAAEMPSYVADASGDDEILVADIDELKAQQTVSETGEIIIDNRVNVFDIVKASDFAAYRSTLNAEKSYKIVTTENGQRYMGFIDGANTGEIFTYQANVSDIEAMYQAAPATEPAPIPSYSTIFSRAETIGFEDFDFKLTDGSSVNSKYKAFRIDISDTALAALDNPKVNNESTLNLKLIFRGDVSVGLYLWVVKNDNATAASINPVNGNTTRTFNLDLSGSDWGLTSSDIVSVVGMVYFPTATTGYGMVSPQLTVGYTDDVTGSITEAAADTTTPAELTTFTQYTLTDGNDVDVFHLKQVADCYKVSIKNRSTDDEASLPSTLGSDAKVLTVHSARYPTNSEATVDGNVYQITNDADYTVPRNADMSIYCSGSQLYWKSFVSLKMTDIHLSSGDAYQLSYEVYGSSGGGIEEG